jgi:hypothetical protein
LSQLEVEKIPLTKSLCEEIKVQQSLLVTIHPHGERAVDALQGPHLA